MKRSKQLLSAFLLFGYATINAQVGINTVNPQGAFHVDGAKDNASTGAPTAAQQANDIVFTANGTLGIGTTDPASSSAIEIASTTKGFLAPRMTTAQRVAIDSPVKGLEVFDTTTNSSWYHNGTAWVNSMKWVDGTTANSITNSNSGNVGIGTAAPTAKLQVNGTFRLVDGSQGADRVLTTNANGDASWKVNNSAKPTIIGIIPSAAVVGSSGTADPLYSQMYIDLPAGKWIVSAGLSISRNSGTTNLWEHLYLSSSTSSVTQTNFTHSGPAGASSCYAGNILSETASYSFIQGSNVINVTATTRIYLLLQNQAYGAFTFKGNFFENYFYAVPIN